MKKVHIVGGDVLIERMFTKQGYTPVEDASDAELLCFTGGADVHPDIYHADVHPTTRSNLQRDLTEMKVFKEFPDLPKVGICRGSQFLNVMSGGTLWQDVDNHAIGGTHELHYFANDHYRYDWKDHLKDDDPDRHGLYRHPSNVDGTQISVTSTHHQMMRPNKETSELWGFAYLSRHRDTGSQMKRRTNFEFSPDVEIVYYPGTKSLCFQPHPEYGVKSCEDLFFTCLERAFPNAVVG